MNKFYAIGDALLSEPVEGAIEITEDQYNAALAAKYDGRQAYVLEGELIIHSGNLINIWECATKAHSQIDDQLPVPHTHTVIEPVGDVVFDPESNNWVPRVLSEQELAYVEHTWVIQELQDIQVQLMYHWTDDSRARYTIEDIKAYARDLRDYTTTDEDGVPSVVGSIRPRIGGVATKPIPLPETLPETLPEALPEALPETLPSSAKLTSPKTNKKGN